MTDTETDTEAVLAEDHAESDLRTWGLSGQPSTWALSTWTSLIDVIRAANQGSMDQSAVQDALDAVYPDGGYDAANIVLPHPPAGDFTVTTDEATNSVRVDLAGDADLLLPDDNITWEFGDNSPIIHDAGGWDHTYEAPGEYRIRLTMMVAGASYGSDQVVTFGEPVLTPLDPGVAARAATDFDSDTDDRPNSSVTPEQTAGQSAAVADQIAAGRMVPGDAYVGAGGEEYPPAAEAQPKESGPYDPSEHTVDEVLAYAAEHPDEAHDIAVAEEAGKGRVTILDRLA